MTSKLFNNKVIKGFELSSGKYSNTFESDLSELSKSFKFTFHNYFPVPKEPFVFNLASFNDDILLKSKEHARNAIVMTAKYGGDVYSFHAGYLIDPLVSELGKTINKTRLNDRDKALDYFIDNVNELANFAADYNVRILIENNVVSHKNFESFNCNPLLMTEPIETDYIFNRVNNNVGLLIDVAHLKVSAKTLNFDPVKYLNEFKNITAAYHISDNNGLEDSNEPFTKDSWFVKHIRKDLQYYSLEIYVSDVSVLEQQYDLLSEILR